jgi:hypothetical protein
MKKLLGVTLMLVVIVSIAGMVSAQDWDGDSLDDAMEDNLARLFFPNNNMDCGTYEGTEYGSEGQFYGSEVGVGQLGQLPYVAHFFVDGLSDSCPTMGQCIEIRYGMAYNWDLGDDQFQDTLGKPHKGDTEMVALLLRTDADPAAASNDPSLWHIHKIYRTAHACATGESSSYQLVDSWTAPDNWVSEGKNGNYVSSSSCDDGGELESDECNHDRCWINRDHAVGKLQNAGEFENPGTSNGNIIPAPGDQPNFTPSSYYDVWGTTSFGSAGTFCRHLHRRLDWANEQRACAATPECG